MSARIDIGLLTGSGGIVEASIVLDLGGRYNDRRRGDLPQMDERETATEERATTPEQPGEDGLRQKVLEALKQVYDPELGINIVDLGLVYEVEVHDDGDVDISYSLTTMGCPIGPLIEDQIRAFLAPIEGLGEVRPDLVFRPPWSPELMSDEAKAALGIF
jgi:metal-sulfur cluster biosynthetic enzyme